MQRPELFHQSQLDEPQKIQIFSDLNCPFCFAMHERIESLGLNNHVLWCFVEHAPAFNSELRIEEQAALLQHEYSLIRQRASEVKINRPNFCVNTRLAILSLVSLAMEDEDKAALYRQSLFSAYWQHGLDISDPQILHRLLLSVGACGLDVTDDARDKQKQWQKQWQLGDYDLRIPLLLTADLQVMYGLQHSENIKNFLRRINQTPSLQGATCFHTGNFNIAVLGLESLVEEYLLHPSGINLTNFDNVNDLIRENSLNTFDGIVINYQTDKIRNYILIRQLKEQLNIGIELPIIYLAFEAKHEDEIQAFALGANEFAQRKLGLDALSARLKNCLTQARVVRLLHRHAVIDGLTGILNKREFQQNLEKEWRNACRNKLSLSLVMIDIDFFKFYNDNYGHCAGDDILRKVANCLGKDLYRAKDVLARFGGEEFVILLPETKSHGLEFICQQIRSNIEHLALPHSASSISPYITISIGGCSATPHPDQTPTQMLKLADAALYQAKERGRNQYVLNELASISYD